jgi:hypothetical protein
MVMLDFLQWWYEQGWQQTFQNFVARLRRTAWYFSAPLLLRTMFAPWRRIVTPPGRGFDAQLRALGDNLFSRCIGFVVRLFVLIAAAVSLIVVGVVSLLELALWPLAPLAVIVGVVWGIIG